WLETNGIGGFASSTVVGAHTRRYHGLLVAALTPPVSRHSMLTALDIAVITDERDHMLTTHLYPDTVFPQGYRTLERFELVPFPRWTHRLQENLTVIRELWMDPGRNTTVLVWRLPEGTPRVELRMLPLLGLRDFHTLTRAADFAPALVETSDLGRLSVHPEGTLVSSLHLHHTARAVETHNLWYNDFRLPVESTREEQDGEDLWNPCRLIFDLSPDNPAVLIASTDEEIISDPRGFAEESLAARLRDEERTQLSFPAEPAIERLAPAVRAFRVQRADDRPTILAGYHWFADWGRDTMIALPGLHLIHGHVREAIDTLRSWMRHLDAGMLPNRFPDHGEPPEYNTADAALWFSVAVVRTWQCLGGRGPGGLVPRGDAWAPPAVPQTANLSNGEASFLHESLTALEKIIAAHQEGTRHGIHMDEEGLITQGEPGQQLTWMDAKWGDQVFTPRHGRPIEIQALWHTTLRTAALLRRVFGDLQRAKEHEALATCVSEAVVDNFRVEDQLGLADVIGPDGQPDLSIRPNQIFAVSLPFPMISGVIASEILAVVEEHLLTPWGLRSLAPGDPKYVGIYHGPRRIRDAAYHQGTIWSWLMGPWVDASLRVRGATAETAAALRERLQPLVDHIDTQHGLGSISQIFDGDLPHLPRGCIAQAWSVAELLRVLWTIHLLQGQKSAR
ncbi:glycogen debranching enzyme family protein, partial [Candidatus Sumerlaeota bacterium]|nr:glycogen debranching enzyme family protein [Candidatus Sumerlaeota bacterium]